MFCNVQINWAGCVDISCWSRICLYYLPDLSSLHSSERRRSIATCAVLVHERKVPPSTLSSACVCWCHSWSSPKPPRRWLQARKHSWTFTKRFSRKSSSDLVWMFANGSIWRVSRQPKAFIYVYLLGHNYPALFFQTSHWSRHDFLHELKKPRIFAKN